VSVRSLMAAQDGDMIIPYPTGRILMGLFPGTSCQATIISSLRDRKASAFQSGSHNWEGSRPRDPFFLEAHDRADPALGYVQNDRPCSRRAGTRALPVLHPAAAALKSSSASRLQSQRVAAERLNCRTDS